jgi:hypothetical protein
MQLCLLMRRNRTQAIRHAPTLNKMSSESNCYRRAKLVHCSARTQVPCCHQRPHFLNSQPQSHIRPSPRDTLHSHKRTTWQSETRPISAALSSSIRSSFPISNPHAPIASSSPHLHPGTRVKSHAHTDLAAPGKFPRIWTGSTLQLGLKIQPIRYTAGGGGKVKIQRQDPAVRWRCRCQMMHLKREDMHVQLNGT